MYINIYKYVEIWDISYSGEIEKNTISYSFIEEMIIYYTTWVYLTELYDLASSWENKSDTSL